MIHLSDLPNWAGARRVGLDIETCDPQLKDLGPGVKRDGYIVGVSFAVDMHGTGAPNCPAAYLPIRHRGGGNYPDPEQVFAYLQHQLDQFDGEIVVANGQYDLDYLMEAGLKFRHTIHDVQVAGALLLQPEMEWQKDEDGRMFLVEKFQRMNLDALCERLGVVGKDETKLNAWAEEHGLNPKVDLWKAHSDIVAPYAIQDARAPLAVLRKQLREIRDQDLDRVWELESDLLPVLLDMRRIGVRVNFDKLDQVEQEAERRKHAAATVISQRSGIKFSAEDINKAAVLEKHLNADGIKCPRTPTGLPSVKAGWLAELNTPVARAMIRSVASGTRCRARSSSRSGAMRSITAITIGSIARSISCARSAKTDQRRASALGACRATSTTKNGKPFFEPKFATAACARS